MKNDKKQTPEKLNPKKRDRRSMLQVRKELESTTDGRLSVPGLGVFIVRTVTNEKDGQPMTRKKISLRLKKPGKSTPSTPPPPAE